jgi:Rieske Fe-S protein
MASFIGTVDHDDAVPVDPSLAPMGRRRFLLWAAGASLGASAVFIGATVIQAMVPPARSVDGRKSPGKLAVARLSDLQVDKPRRTEYGQDTVFVVKTSATQALVFDAACPHMGCELVFNDRTREFDCPCHNSGFSIDGARLRGPAPRDMLSAVSEIVNGEVVVSGFRA